MSAIRTVQTLRALKRTVSGNRRMEKRACTSGSPRKRTSSLQLVRGRTRPRPVKIASRLSAARPLCCRAIDGSRSTPAERASRRSGGSRSSLAVRKDRALPLLGLRELSDGLPPRTFSVGKTVPALEQRPRDRLRLFVACPNQPAGIAIETSLLFIFQ